MEIMYVDWEEILISNEKGKREVHYFLKRKEGLVRDLAVIGKERTIRHMFYTIALSNPPLLKLKSRREVLDWLSSIVSASQVVGDSLSCGGALNSKVHASKKFQTSEQHSKRFAWLGSSWTCRKRRRHYMSFCRNGITVSVHDFVYVLAEENKRLIAYLEDLYEDSRSNRMVVVRWFHKIDEVGIVLPPDYNDREIFFSLCLQDLSVECIDGLATVLSPQHFEKFQNQATDTQWEPFMCHRQFHNEDITTFDISQVQGYWEQDTVRYLNRLSDRMDLIPDLPGHCLVIGDDDSTKTRPRKKLRRSKSSEDLHLVDEKEAKELGHLDVKKCHNDLVDSSCCAEVSGHKEVNSAPSAPVVGMDQLTPGSYISVGCHVEVLSQDSGIRGCWYGGVVLKSNKDKVKVRYQDVKDAIDEANSLEEWVSASRTAVPDKLECRLRGRGTVRPRPSTNISLGPIKVGASVDAWWHDGWWEGIVIHNESDERVHVYFPGEARLSIFCIRDLRRSQDWLCNKWNWIKERPDLAQSILSDLEKTKQLAKIFSCQVNCDPNHVTSSDNSHHCVIAQKYERETSAEANLKLNSVTDGLVQLKWNSSSKKRRSRERLYSRTHEGPTDSKQLLQQPFIHISRNISHVNSESRISGGNFLIAKSLKVDLENCKYGGNSVLKSSVCPLTNLVMSQ
ncbi:hypothetical protein MKW92_024253 [Papaver armeniacum]|nr:hypothetical protein MKW92_024253 [Papaver armeniacum]